MTGIVKEEEIRTQIYTEERASEDMGRRELSISQGERSQRKPNLASQTSAYRDLNKFLLCNHVLLVMAALGNQFTHNSVFLNIC